MKLYFFFIVDFVNFSPIRVLEERSRLDDLGCCGVVFLTLPNLLCHTYHLVSCYAYCFAIQKMKSYKLSIWNFYLLALLVAGDKLKGIILFVITLLLFEGTWKDSTCPSWSFGRVVASCKRDDGLDLSDILYFLK